MISISILFSGRGTNAQSILKSIIKKDLNFKVKKVVCNNSHAVGINKIRNLGVDVSIIDQKKYANKEEFNRAVQNLLNPKEGELLLLCGYMKKIPDEIIKSYFGNIINIHPSLLPRYKGLNTHEKVILNNDTVHGCTTHYVTTNIDDGPIIAQSSISVLKNDTPEKIASRLLSEEHKLFYNTLKLVENNYIKLKNKKILYKGNILRKPIIFN